MLFICITQLNAFYLYYFLMLLLIVLFHLGSELQLFGTGSSGQYIIYMCQLLFHGIRIDILQTCLYLKYATHEP
jgi:hypothetical protein